MLFSFVAGETVKHGFIARKFDFKKFVLLSRLALQIFKVFNNLILMIDYRNDSQQVRITIDSGLNKIIKNIY